jgi:hypothetical protein
LILAELRASYAGRSTPVNAWWGSFDVAVSLFADERELAVGWWPGDARYGRAAFYAYARPAPEGFEDADLSPPAARWSSDLDEFLLDWDEVVGGPGPRATGLEFARSALREAWGG